MNSYEEFRAAVFKMIDEVGPFYNSEKREVECRKLWERFGLQEYAERLYLLQRDDARGIAEAMGVDLDALEASGQLPDHFWEDVQSVIEHGFESWSEVVRTAIEHALSQGGIQLSD